jgi:hypothetical protein
VKILFLSDAIVQILRQLNRVNEQEQLEVTKQRQELAETIEFENVVRERIEDLNVKLKNSNNLRESDILVNEIDTLLDSAEVVLAVFGFNWSLYGFDNSKKIHSLVG